MKKEFLSAMLLVLFFHCLALAQTTDSLRQKIYQILSTKNAIVGVSINGKNGKDTLSINDARHFAMQSVYKFHIALVVLSQIDNGKLLQALLTDSTFNNVVMSCKYCDTLYVIDTLNYFSKGAL